MILRRSQNSSYGVGEAKTKAQILGIFLALTLSFCSVRAYGQTPICDPENPKLCAAYLKKGEPAPFDGQILTTELAIVQAQSAHDCAEKCSLRLSKERARLQVLLEAKEAFIGEIERSHDQELALLQLHLDEARQKLENDRLWYERPIFVSIFSVAGTCAILYAGVQVVKIIGK